MKNIFYQTEDGHLFDYEDIVALLIFEFRKLKDEGWKEEEVLEYFANENFEGDTQYIEILRRIVLKTIFELIESQ